MNQITTTKDYWDCECKENYIHPKTQNHCDKCNTNSDEQPDSRIDELPEYTIGWKITKSGESRIGALSFEEALQRTLDGKSFDFEDAEETYGAVAVGNKIHTITKNETAEMVDVENDKIVNE